MTEREKTLITALEDALDGIEESLIIGQEYWDSCGVMGHLQMNRIEKKERQLRGLVKLHREYLREIRNRGA